MEEAIEWEEKASIHSISRRIDWISWSGLDQWEGELPESGAAAAQLERLQSTKTLTSDVEKHFVKYLNKFWKER